MIVLLCATVAGAAACSGGGDTRDVRLDVPLDRAEGEDGRIELVTACGNGVVEGDEECDDGNDVDRDGCDKDCRYSCYRSSECDDGNICNGLETCNESHACVSTPAREDGFACGAAPRRICLDRRCVDSTCGDGFVDTGRWESCEPPGGEGCNGSCRRVCDGDAGCPDDGNPCNGEEYCRVSARQCESRSPLDEGEPCPGTAGGVCVNRLCEESVCGDGRTDAARGEECDDWNSREGDGCDNDCTFSCSEDADCGDGDICNGAEVCGAGHACRAGARMEDGSVCSVAPRKICVGGTCSPTRCGDAVVDTGGGESCEPPSRGGCGPTCARRCDGDEDCFDDGDPCNGEEFCDTAAALCAGRGALEDGIACGEGTPRQVCMGRTCQKSMCGDGFTDLLKGEQCDDRNGIEGDGCDNDCTWSCGDAGECDDGRACTRDECDAAAHVCTHSLEAAGAPCRPAADVCDAPDACDGTAPDCPADTFVAAGTLCRAAAGGCDDEEVCSGSLARCPADRFKGAGAVCRPASGGCDEGERCDGSSLACPADRFKSRTEVCRPSAGYCDVAETCTGAASACPPDLFKGPETVCNVSTGGCDPEERCTGSAHACPANAIAASGAVCRAASGVCDVEERCSGSAVACPANAFRASPATCRAAAGVCDAAESCTGTAAACPADLLMPSTAVCRTAAGECDLVELCAGSLAACPANAFTGAGTACSDADDCTWPDRCDGRGACAGTNVMNAARQVAAGESHSCALFSSGSVKCWGDNSIGQLGDGTDSDRAAPVDVTGLAGGIAAVAAGYGHGCALASGGGVRCWGDNGNGQLGDGTAVAKWAPVQVLGLTGGVAAIAAGGRHTCAVMSTGALRCWGANEFGELGDLTTSERWSPVQVSGLTSGVKAAAVGGRHTCALLSIGGVKCWGRNVYGEVGDNTIVSRSAPVDVAGLTSGALAVSAGSSFTCAVVVGGSVRCWGRNDNGQLGNGTALDSRTPVEVANLGGTATSVAAGASLGPHACALLTTGAVRCWGKNDDAGQVGDGTLQTRFLPVTVGGLSSGAAAISAGGVHTCALMTSGNVQCWGAPFDGQLGDGAYGTRPAPVQVATLAAGAAGAVSAGTYHSCAVKTGGAAVCWGYNANGQLGNGTVANSASPAQVNGLLSGILMVSSGGFHSCALTGTGGVLCWGYNGAGQVGNGTLSDSWVPYQVSGLVSGWAAVAAGGYHTCALGGAGQVVCWGYNEWGQVGDGTTLGRTTPVGVSGLTSGVAAITAGNMHTCALLTTGGLRCWGYNVAGQLGDGTTASRATPVSVTGLELWGGVRAVSAGGGGGNHTCAVLTTGAVRCWGLNEYGQLGDGTGSNRATHSQVVGLTAGGAAVAAGGGHTCAILSAGGGVKCWGANGTGELGDGTVTGKITPVPVTGLTAGAATLSAGGYHTCALLTTGAVHCWGDDSMGQATSLFPGYPHPVVCH